MPKLMQAIQDYTSKECAFEVCSINHQHSVSELRDSQTDKVVLGYTKGGNFIPTILNAETEQEKRINFTITQHWMKLRYWVISELDFLKNCDIYDNVSRTYILTFNKRSELIHTNVQKLKKLESFFKFPQEIKSFEDLNLENIACTGYMQNVFQTIISDMIKNQRTEYGISSPYIHVRMKWDWRNKFQGFTMIFKSRARKDTNDLAKNFANNFSYVMAPVENEIVDIGKALTAILSKGLGSGDNRTFIRENSLLVPPLQSVDAKPERSEPKKKSLGGLEHPQQRDRTIVKKLSKFSTEGSKISGEVMPIDQVTQRRRIKKNNTDMCRINWMKNQLPSEGSSGLGVDSSGKLASSSGNILIPGEAEQLDGLSMQRNLSKFSERPSDREVIPAVVDVSKTFLAYCMSTDHLKDTYVMEYLNMKNEKDKPDRNRLKTHASRSVFIKFTYKKLNFSQTERLPQRPSTTPRSGKKERSLKIP